MQAPVRLLVMADFHHRYKFSPADSGTGYLHQMKALFALVLVAVHQSLAAVQQKSSDFQEIDHLEEQNPDPV